MRGDTRLGPSVALRSPRLNIFPPGTTRSARALLFTRSVRAFADGVVSVLLTRYLKDLGYDPLHAGALLTGTMLGSAALTAVVGLVAHRFDRKRLLLAAAGLMLLTGLGFW